MPPANRRPNKHERRSRNRQERAARAARSARAGEATAISRGERQPVGPPRASAVPAGASGRKARRAAARQDRPGRRSMFKVPGQRAVVMALLFTVVSAVTLLISPVRVPREVPPTDPRVEDESPEVNDDGLVVIYENVKLLDEEGAATGGAILVTPIVICGFAVAFTKRRQRILVWTMAMLAMSGFVFFFAGFYGIISLPSLIALAIGAFQARRAENKERLGEIRAKRATEAGAEEIESGDVESGDVESGEVDSGQVEGRGQSDEAER